MLSICFGDNQRTSLGVIDIGYRISGYQGMLTHNIILPNNEIKPQFPLPPAARSIVITQQGKLLSTLGNSIKKDFFVTDRFTATITAITQSASVGMIPINSVLFAYDPRVDWYLIIEHIIKLKKDVFLYLKDEKHINENSNIIDVWWRGEENGNLMSLMAYIINNTETQHERDPKKIRIIRKLPANADHQAAHIEMNMLLQKARLKGEVVILTDDNKTFHQTLQENSKNAWLILMGVPGERKKDKFLPFADRTKDFNKEIVKYEGLPPILFTKASRIMNLIEE
jgi:hypothetical protein